MATEQEKRRIIDDARKTLLGRLDAGADTDAAWPAPPGRKKARDEPDEPPPVPEPPPAPVDWSKWEEWVQARIQSGIARERAWLCDEVLPGVLAEILEQSRRESRSDIADEREKARKEQKDNVARERRRVDLAIDKAIAGLRGELTRLITDSIIKIEGVVCAERVARDAERTGIGGLDPSKPPVVN